VKRDFLFSLQIYLNGYEMSRFEKIKFLPKFKLYSFSLYCDKSLEKLYHLFLYLTKAKIVLGYVSVAIKKPFLFSLAMPSQFRPSSPGNFI